MTVPVNGMENLAASGSVPGSLKVNSAALPPPPRGNDRSPYKASGSSGGSRISGCCCERAHGDWAVPYFGHGSAPAALDGEAESIH